MKKTKIAAFTLITCITMFSTASNVMAKDFAPEDDGKIHLNLAYCVDCTDSSQQLQWDMTSQYIDYLNNTRDDLYIEATLFDANSTLDTQIANIETAITMDADAIILSAVDTSSIVPTVQQAQAAGIKVLDWRGSAGDLNYVGANEDSWGQLNYEWTKQYLEDHPDEVLYAGLQYGGSAMPEQFKRLDPLKELAEEYPDRFIILADQYCDWTTDTAMKMAEDWIQAYPDMNYICSASGTMMSGVVEALRGANKLDDMVLCTFNGLEEDFNMLRKGDIDTSVGAYYPVKMGLLVEDTIEMLLEDKSGTDDVGELTTFIATQDTVEDCAAKSVADYENVQAFESTLKDSYVK